VMCLRAFRATNYKLHYSTNCRLIDDKLQTAL
jgi:hypothetical protein